ncbi:MAG: hypothetical protein K9N51_11580 [Candidatus Pacebacteria bacterium]|nr:hypothetical protein [Candidatus Paceibacterota bacterium]
MSNGDRLDHICRRQTARFLDHLRDTGQATARLERDVKRLMRFVFIDVKTAMQGQSQDTGNGKKERL